MNVLKTHKKKQKEKQNKSAYEMTSQFKDNGISCCCYSLSFVVIGLQPKNGIIAMRQQMASQQQN